MTGLPEIALTFAKEVLGWEGEIRHNAGLETLRRVGDTDPYASRYTDLNAVIEAVVDWCEKSDMEFTLHHFHGGRYQALINDKDTARVEAIGESQFPTAALMLACIETKRRMGAA